jgi:methyl-accepting chemotaxis protein
MSLWIKEFISPPVFKEDEDKTRSASLLNVMMLVLLVVTPITCIVLSWFQPQDAALNLTSGALLTLIFLGVRDLNRRGRVQLSGALLSTIIWLAVTFLAMSMGRGLNDPIVTGYFVVTALATILVSERAAAFFTGASAIALTGLYLSQVRASDEMQPSDPMTILIVLIAMMLLLTFLFRFAVRHMIMALDRARRNEQAQIESNQQLGETNQQLLVIRASLEQRAAWERDMVQKYVLYMGEVGRGNLAASISLQSNGQEDEPLLMLGHSLLEMTANLEDMTAQLRDAAAHLSSLAGELSAATTQQLAGASQQTSAISQTATTIEEIKAIVDLSLQKAQTVAEQSQRVTQVSQQGQQAVALTMTSMGEIKERVAGIATNILALSEQNLRIGEIIATVNELAAQSNLLALNASVEAARAGEHGRGFAVVAAEVRKLAEQSRQATAQVRAILNEIQRATNASVLATEEGTKGVDQGAQLAEQTGDTIKQLIANITESMNAAQQILASARQQTTGMEQIAQAIRHINQATVQNLASTRQTEKAAHELSHLAAQMEQLVSRYKLSQADPLARELSEPAPPTSVGRTSTLSSQSLTT